LDPCAALAAASLFRGSASTDFEPLARHIVERSYPRATYLWHAGDTAESVYLILAGEISTSRLGPDGNEYIVEVYISGDVMGQLPLLDERPTRLLHAMAVAPTRCLVFPLAQLRRLIEDRPRLMVPMLATYSRWIRQRDAQASETAFQNLSGRVASKLLELSSLTATPPGKTIPIDLPQGRLAGMLGASRENVNRALARLVARGEVQRRGRQLLIPDPNELARRYSWATPADPVLTPR
jgi:CRP/FNR family cyclic AMP-dependent transcriptional regulator